MKTRSAQVVFILIWILGLNLNCAPASGRKEFMELEENKGPVVLVGSVKQENGSLVISYELTNRSRDQILAWDEMIGYKNGEDAIDNDLAYLCFEDPGTARVVRGVLSLPIDRDVYQKEIPYARTVEPLGSVTGRIVLPLPLDEYNPYYPMMPPEDEKDAPPIKETLVNKIRLMIGWTEIRPGMIVTETEIGGKKVKMIRGAWGSPLQKIADVQIPLNANLRVRTDSFDRRPPQQ
jgi:hypothetical protein